MSENAMDFYYSRLFPAGLIYKWLSNGRDPRSKDPNFEDTFPRREFSFTLAGDIYCRHKSFETPEDLVKDLCKEKPEKIDIGAVWTLPPKSRNSYTNSIRYETVEKEFVIDIDMTDYDNVRTCCRGATVCKKCWKFLAVACKSVDMALNYSFGYNLRLWVFSGRRGIHCWVSDPEAKRLNDFKRKFLIEFLNSGPKLHTPFIEIHNEILTQAFEEIIVIDQDLLADPTHVNTVIELIVEGGVTKSDLFKDQAEVSGPAFWDLVKSRNLDPKIIMKICYKFLYPRLDVHVSTSTNHLLKSPFSVHPATHKVCIPFDARFVDSFDLDLVPSVEETVEGSVEFDKAVGFFESFVQQVRTRGLAEKSRLLKFNRETQEQSDKMEVN